MLDGSRFPESLSAEIWERADTFDHLYSRFRDDSLVAELFRTGRIDHPPAEMIAMLDFAREIHEASEGMLNLSVGGSLHAKGYGERKYSGRVLPDLWDHLSYDSQAVTLPPGIMLDFGGFGKGWLIDAIVEICRQHGAKNFIVNGGGDLYVDADTPIDIYLEHPTSPTHAMGQTKITRGALAASSVYKRVWREAEKKHHHIIDLTTGQSSNDGAAATYVKADSALIADTMATILIIRPDLEPRLKKQYGLETIVLNKDQIVDNIDDVTVTTE